MQVPPPQAGANDATAISVGPFSIVLDGAAKFGANWYCRRLLVVSKFKKSPGVPSAGGVAPSRSEGRKLPSFGTVKQMAAGEDAWPSIAVRSYAQSCAPVKVCPLANML